MPISPKGDQQMVRNRWLAAFSAIRNPIGFLLVGGAVGIAGTVAFMGFPMNRSAEAAAWASAVATIAAVLAALHVAKGQINVAREAADGEQKNARELQANDREHSRQLQRTKAVRMAHAFSRELVFARRDLMILLANVRPAVMQNPSDEILAVFVNSRPLPELSLIERFADQLDGFEDADAFSILTLLSAWQNFNRGPGMSANAISLLPMDRRARMAENRFTHGRAILAAIDRLVNQLANYYENHEAMEGMVVEELPPELAQLFR
ncbi:hypothetical protein CEE60_05870 [Stenotrophomonas maltophilia]|uniref:Transmembrane protein n=1 Tax=Stenotrophomonas maltophilia TaxID=40324 RepID=A0A246HP61_STEMA|nr:hypothetical protein [Stenotrophomonas maltophilia]OWQ55079.1 hypothetical protein CEE60_05870 [Stenotrophomonas maltophilia]